MDYKQRIKKNHLDRKVLADRLGGLSYAAFTARLNGFIRFTQWEEKTLESILTECEAVQREMAERLDRKADSIYAN